MSSAHASSVPRRRVRQTRTTPSVAPRRAVNAANRSAKALRPVPGNSGNGLAIPWFVVLGTSVVPFFVAAGVTALLGLAWKSAAKVMAWIGLIFALVTVPGAFLATPELGTAIALGSMHVVVGIAWYLAVRRRA